MKKTYQTLALSFCLTGSVNLAFADIGGNLSLTSDYRHRGISQSNETVAIQGGIDWFNDQGFYASVWASNVDFFPTGSILDDGAAVEFDVWAGYAGSINDDLSYDMTLYYFQYPGDDIDQNFVELGLGLNYEDFRLAYNYANDHLNLGLANQYIALSYTAVLPQELSLELHAGHSFGELYDDPAVLGLEEYTDYSISLSKTLADFDLKASYINTDISGAYRVDSGHMANQDTLLVSISRSF